MTDQSTSSEIIPGAVPEIEVIDAWRVACDGGGGALGHPRVWLSLDPKTGWVECGYCDKRFVHRNFVGTPDR